MRTNIVQQMQEKVVRDLIERWGGSLPTWGEFKAAARSGTVRVNKSVANRFVLARAVPLPFRILYGIITPSLVFLSVPAAVGYWLIVGGSPWWIAGGFLAAWFSYKVTLEGNCEAVKAGAERDQQFYEGLVSIGAFMFEPRRGA